MFSYVAAEMVHTPWGRMADLRERRLRPGPGAARKAVLQNQRERLLGAMVASTATKGYPATTVADLIFLAGVSRATFYEHFETKADCFKATVEELFAAGLSLISEQLRGPGNPKERGQRALRSFLTLAASQPAAAKMSLVDAYSAGAAGLDPINNAFEEACGLTHEALRMLPNRGGTPEQMSRAIIGGVHRVIYVRLYRGEEKELLGQGDELWRWLSGYEPPEGLQLQKRKRRSESASPHLGRNPHERILRGFARTVAARGFQNATVPQVAAETGISNATFYRHFENKDDALLAALDMSGAQLIAATMPAARRESDWPFAVNRAIKELCGFFAAEPPFAKLRTVEVYAAGPEAIAQRDRAWEEILDELVPPDILSGAEPGRTAVEASSGAIYALLYEKVRKDEFETLHDLAPLLSYLVLAPLTGTQHATAVAAGRPTESLADA